MTKILIVTVQYFQHDKTIAMLRSLFQTQSPDYQLSVIIVDNAYFESGNISIEDDLSKFGENIKYIGGRNIGYFGGLNSGIEAAGDLGGFKHIVACNNDLTFDVDFFANLINYGGDFSERICLVPRIVGPNSIEQNPQYVDTIPWFKRITLFLIYHFPSRLGFAVYEFLRKKFGRDGMIGRSFQVAENSKLISINLPLGAIFIFSPNLYRTINGLPNESFLYGEEILLRRSLVNFGCEFKLATNLFVHHFESATTNALSAYSKWNMQRSAFRKFRWFYLAGK